MNDLPGVLLFIFNKLDEKKPPLTDLWPAFSLLSPPLLISDWDHMMWLIGGTLHLYLPSCKFISCCLMWLEICQKLLLAIWTFSLKPRPSRVFTLTMQDDDQLKVVLLMNSLIKSLSLRLMLGTVEHYTSTAQRTDGLDVGSYPGYTLPHSSSF